MTPKVYGHYLGKGGQLAVMSHLVTRGLNVAIPEIDVGSDVFVVQDDTSQLWRIQAKTATARRNRDRSFSAKFFLSESQLRVPSTPDNLVYSLIFHHDARWLAFINIPRSRLQDALSDMKATRTGALTPTLRLTPTQVLCDGSDLEPYRDEWRHFPDLRPGRRSP